MLLPAEKMSRKIDIVKGMERVLSPREGAVFARLRITYVGD